MKKSTRILLIASALLAVAIGATLLLRELGGYAVAVRANWGVVLPTGYHESFGYSTPSPHGDGVRVHVLSYNAGSVRYARAAELFERAVVVSESDAEKLAAWFAEAETPTVLIPDLRQMPCLYLRHEDGSELYLFRDDQAGTITVAERFL